MEQPQPHGPAAVRRRGLRQNRGGAAAPSSRPLWTASRRRCWCLPPFWRSSIMPAVMKPVRTASPCGWKCSQPVSHRRRSRRRFIQQLKEGEIDIIVGTHRLLAKDVQFKDLGLFGRGRGAALRRGAQGGHSKQLKQQRGRTDPLGHAHSPHAAHVHGGHPGYVRCWRPRRRSATRCRPM